MVSIGEGRKKKMMKVCFLAVPCENVYNCILGRHFLATLDVIAYTVHLKMKYPNCFNENHRDSLVRIPFDSLDDFKRSLCNRPHYYKEDKRHFCPHHRHNWSWCTRRQSYAKCRVRPFRGIKVRPWGRSQTKISRLTNSTKNIPGQFI